MICKHCGFENQYTEEYCIKCGGLMQDREEELAELQLPDLPEQDFKKWKQLKTVKLKPGIGFFDSPSKSLLKTKCLEISFSPDSLFMALACNESLLRICIPETGKTYKSSWGHDGLIKCVRYSPCGKIIATGSDDCTIRIWDVENFTCIKTLEGHSGTVNSITFTPDGKKLISGSQDSTIRIWDVKDGKTIRKIAGYSSFVTKVDMLPRSKNFASASENIIRMWHTEKEKQITTLKGHLYAINSMEFSPDRKHLLTCDSCFQRHMGTHNYAIVWDVIKMEWLRKLNLSPPPYSGTFYPDGKYYALGLANSIIKIFRTIDGKELISMGKPAPYFETQYPTDEIAVGSLAFSPDGRFLVAGLNNGDLRTWESNL